jgi:prevent-host-death family protein
MALLGSKPVTEVKRHATEIIAELQRSRKPVVITEHGRSAAVLVDVETFDRLNSRLALLEGVTRGERAFSDGRTVSHTEAKRRLGRWLPAPRR